MTGARTRARGREPQSRGQSTREACASPRRRRPCAWNAPARATCPWNRCWVLRGHWH